MLAVASCRRHAQALLRLGIAEADGALVGINTGRANTIVAEGLCAHRIPGLPVGTLEREVKVGAKSRLDFRLADDRAAIPTSR